jgi:uncharacterized protein with von Willebrand factor type A (vWA) domain
MTALPAEQILVSFAHALRAGGLTVTADRTHAFLTASACAGADERAGVYWAGRATLCASPDDLETYDKVFDAWFSVADKPRRTERPPARTVQQAALEVEQPTGDGEGDEQVLRAVASGQEVLRHRDVASLSPTEKRRLASMFASLDVSAPMRRSLRRRPHHHGEVDARRSLRDQLRRGGEPGPLLMRRRRPRPRRVVLLIDVSGSMEPYADALLRLGHRMVTALPGVEVFTVGTRLTRVTDALRSRDPDAALLAAGQVVPDWSGGTRLGESLRAFTDRWGQRGTARGAVVVIASDGWERGDPRLLGEQVQRLHRLARAVVWTNPHRGKEGYEPVQGGIVAVLPHLDALVAGHSLQTYERLLEVVADA